MRRSRALTLVTILAGLSATSIARPPGSMAATLPAGFTETPVAQVFAPTRMEFAPDGRLFVGSQGGTVHIVKDGALLPTPFITLDVDSEDERGLLGIAFDPQFEQNQWVYINRTVTTPVPHQQVSRFTANGDVAVEGSEQIIWDFDRLSATNHVAGALDFGPDGKLYVAHGDNARSASAQTLDNLRGKVIRINPDGTIPEDNPFYATATGNNRAIWALGLRNPFTFEFQPGTGRMFIHDVGAASFEEVNEGVAGANYGWPRSEGPTTDPAFRAPLFSYPNGSGPNAGCAITGGTFYNPASATFPASFHGSYLFADLCEGWIRRLDPATNEAVIFATRFGGMVDLEVSDGGDLYVLNHTGEEGEATIVRVTFDGPPTAPALRSQPASQTVMAGDDVVFSVASSGSKLLSYQWQRNEVDILGATSPKLRVPAAALADSGARFRVVVKNDAGSVISFPATLTVMECTPPAPS